MRRPLLKVLAFPRRAENPYINLLYESVEQNEAVVRAGSFKEICTGDYDLVHYHWPENFLNRRNLWSRWSGFQRFMSLVLITKLRRKKIAWTMHNVEAHEESGRLLPWLFRTLLFWATDGVIALSKISYQTMVDRYPVLRRKPFLMSWIGDYRTLYPNLPTKDDAKQHVGIAPDQFVIGFFGVIRAYKNVPQLIRLFKQLTDKRLKLLIIGRCLDEALQQELNELAEDDPRIELQTSFLDESEVPWIVRAVDLMVLPFQRLLNSSSAILALSLDVPLLVPAIGSLIEIEQEAGSEWVRTYQNGLTAEVLADAILWATAPRLTRAPLESYSWEACGRETSEFYRSIVNADVNIPN
jgi:beta-1,4-mannosyltransferase